MDDSVVCSLLGGSSVPGPSSEKGKGQKRKLASSGSREGGEDAKKSKKRRKNNGASEDGEDKYVVCVVYSNSNVI